MWNRTKCQHDEFRATFILWKWKEKIVSTLLSEKKRVNDAIQCMPHSSDQCNYDDCVLWKPKISLYALALDMLNRMYATHKMSIRHRTMPSTPSFTTQTYWFASLRKISCNQLWLTYSIWGCIDCSAIKTLQFQNDQNVKEKKTIIKPIYRHLSTLLRTQRPIQRTIYSEYYGIIIQT